jgi:hypothetical protein
MVSYLLNLNINAKYCTTACIVRYMVVIIPDFKAATGTEIRICGFGPFYRIRILPRIGILLMELIFNHPREKTAIHF